MDRRTFVDLTVATTHIRFCHVSRSRRPRPRQKMSCRPPQE